MKATDRESFAEMLTAVHDVYRPDKSMDPMVVGIYWSALSGYDLAAVRQAFDRHVKNPDTGQFMPKPADLIRMIGGSSQDRALQAWALVDQSVRRVGPHQDVVFDDPLIHRVIQEMGGWIAFGTKEADDWPFIGKEFENRYRGYMQRNEKPEYPSILIGYVGAQNRREGYEPDSPVLLGDTAKAMAVLGGGTDKPLLKITRASDMLPVPTAPRLKG